MTESAISPKNIISKLCFAQFGSNSDESREFLKKELYRFLRNSQDRTITRQTIKYWLDKNSQPSRAEAFEMLKSYLSNFHKENDLSRDRKMVFDQITAFLKRQTSGKEEERYGKQSKYKSFALSAHRRLILDFQTTDEDLMRLERAIGGNFFVYHMRLTENEDLPVAREFMSVFRRGKELRFKLWHKNNAKNLSVFRGVVLLVGQIIWFFGLLNEDNPRVRVMSFRNIPNASENFGDIRWGLLMSDIPRPSAHDPVSCRVILHRVENLIGSSDSYEQFAAKSTGPFKIDEKSDNVLKVLERLISNNVTALSKAKTSEPFVDRNIQIVDQVLKVNQDTLEYARDKLSDELLKPSYF